VDIALISAGVLALLGGLGSDIQRKFAFYWRVIRPGRAPIRRMWLEAVRRRAEGSDRSYVTPPVPPGPAAACARARER